MVSSTWDSRGLTSEFVRRWFSRAPATAIVVIGSYFVVSTKPDWLTEGVEADLLQGVLEANAHWAERLQSSGSDRVSTVSDFRRGRAEDVLADACREGDLLVVPTASARRLGFDVLRCPAVLVTAGHHPSPSPRGDIAR